jgi:NAD(P) transhydrogenase
MSDLELDLVVIGSGPAGQRGAIAAAKLGKRVAIVDRRERVGGACLHTGTIPSKTLREAIMYLSGIRQRAFYGPNYAAKEDISIGDLEHRVRTVVAQEFEVIRAQLKRNNVTHVSGSAKFLDPNTIGVDAGDGTTHRLTARFILVACGTRPAHSADVCLDGRRLIDSDQLLGLSAIPRELIVIGGGVIGLEYASMFSSLGTRVTVVDARDQLLDFADRETIELFCHSMRQQNAVFRLGERLTDVSEDARGRILARLASNKVVRGDALLYTVGRTTNADQLDLAAAGLACDGRGKLAVNENFQTGLPHVYAAGDVIGFPALAATSAEQGRLATCHMFGAGAPQVEAALLPYGIYTIPEISMVGATEQSLSADNVPYEIGQARFCELARAQMMGLNSGHLKVLFHRETLQLLGIHAFGESATELVHIGQTAMALGGTIRYFRDAVFNYPTLAEAYKVAGLDGMNRVA